MAVIRLKFLCSSFSTPLTQDEIKEEGLFPVFGASGLVGYSDVHYCSKPYLGIIKDGAGVGRISQYPEKSSLLGTMAYIVPTTKVSISWLRYAIISLELGKDVSSTTIPHIYFKDYGNRFIPDISIDKQCCIAEFLDRRCAEIDHTMEQTRVTIEEYKKLKQSIITETVTHGVRGPRKMKDSGVEWIGEIPGDWRIKRLKYLMSIIVDCPHETPNYSPDGDYLVIRTADQDYATLRSDENMYRLNKEEYENRIRRLSLDIDDIVYGREGERWGLASRVPASKKYCLGQRMMQFRCNKEMILPRFAVYALSSMYVRRQGEYDTFGSTSPHVNIATIRNYAIPTPSITEQKKIAEFLDHRCAEIDRLIDSKQQLLTELEAYKKSVIYEYVTGKREVPQ